VSLVDLLVMGVCLVIGYVVVGSFFDKRYDTPASPDGAAKPESDRDANSRQGKPSSDAGHSQHGSQSQHDAGGPGRPYEPFGPRWATVLGVQPSATRDEISAAYKRKISEYHPDKVTRMGKEIRELAEKRSKEINAAYEEALRRFREPP